ncbi:MAG: DUF4350 domain-containing protein [Thermoanaerobaculia bacterium]
MKSRPLVACGALAAALLGLGVWGSRAQRADYGWRPRVRDPVFASRPILVVVDEAHDNASTASIAGRYWPFARLLRADGCDVRRGKAPFTAGSLSGVSILVVANAAGAPKPQLFGINLPVRTDGKRSDPAFTPSEIAAVKRWVEGGGSLLLVADHAPFGSAAAGLAAAFGVKMHAGFAGVPSEESDPLLFSAENGRLGDHPILRGSGPENEVRRVMTFTGQSLDGPPGATVLLRLPATAVEAVPRGDALVEERAGEAQGLALEQGKGRVVVFGEAGMLTAQVAAWEPFGMNVPGNDNARLALNVVRWLGRRL